jgi:hypothetical protein
LEVVDLAVVCDVDCSLFVVYRLMAAWKVDDAEAGVCEADILVDVESCVIGPSMVENLNHSLEQRFVILAGVAGYAAEDWALLVHTSACVVGCCLIKFLTRACDT